MSLPRKGVTAAVVLAIGLTAAWLFFRRGASEADQSVAPSDRLVINSPAPAPPPWARLNVPSDSPARSDEAPWLKDKPAPAPQQLAESSTSAADNGPQAHLEPPRPVPGVAALPAANAASNSAPPGGQNFGFGAPPPDAIKAFDAQRNHGDAPLAVAGMPTFDGGRTNPGRTHRIVDGDTLGRLAERYLGSTQRQGEIFDANRDRLRDPELLPIGVELRIPSDPVSPPLKPVPPNALRTASP